MNDQRNLKAISALLFVGAICILAVHLVTLSSLNQHVDEVHGAGSDGPVHMEVGTREGATSTWLKRDFDLYGETVDLTGITIDGALSNASDDSIGEWTLRLNITQDCFINQAWNGEVEIHQFAGTDREKVQRMSLQDYDLEDVSLDYLYDGDLLIPLEEGDYVLYWPSRKFKEVPLAAGNDVEIGAIFYCLGPSLDLSDYDLEFSYHRTFTQGPTFYLFVLFASLWLLTVLMHGVSVLAYKRAQNEMELRKAGLSCMSDIYALIYIIDLVTGEVTPVSAAEGATYEYRKNIGAREFLLGGVESSVAAPYQDVMREFVDVGTLAERLKGRDSIMREFISKKHGWCSMRFFAMDRVAGLPVEKVLFTVQDINDEKDELSRVEERISKVESESRAKSAFLASVSREIKAPVHVMLDLGEAIVRESGEEGVRAHAGELNEVGRSLLLLIDGIADFSELEAGTIELSEADYSLGLLARDMVEWARSLARRRNVDFALGVSGELPDGLRGDGERLRRVIGNLLVTCISTVDEGNVKLAVYGKVLEGVVHLLVSVKSSGIGASDEDGARIGFGIGLAGGLLELMGSELKSVSGVDGDYEFYFELEQEVVDARPVGKIILEGGAG